MNKFVNKKTAIGLLGGMLKKGANGHWRTTNYDESDRFGIQGDRLRVVAASYLYRNNQELLIIASGGKGQLKHIPDAPTVAEVIRKELMELGVPKELIIKEENSGNTYQQLREIKKIITERRIKNLGILSSEWHLPRIKAMLEVLEELKSIFEITKVAYLSAEKICLKYNKEVWHELIAQAYKSDGLKERIEQEKRGVQDIREGKYKIK
jgi:hypothetical protein